MKKKLISKVIIFVILFLLILTVVYRISVSHDNYRHYQWIAGFYEEKQDSLDAVYIGGSNVYAYWEPPIAWERYGIAVYPYTCASLPLVAAQYVIEEGRKTQPNALYIISINVTGTSISDTQIHYLTDYMPYSLNRLRLINDLCDCGGIPANKRTEFYFPLIRYHSRWEEWSKEDFHYTFNGLKGGSIYSAFLNNTEDVTSDFRITNRESVLSDPLKTHIEDLLDYCDEENVNVLFITAPQARTNESDVAIYNTINAMVEARGYPYLNMLNCMDEIGLDPKTDYYNDAHTNIHGALKTTDFLSKYLAENYEFEDKRGKSEYSDWDASYEKYLEYITPYVLDVETDYEPRDYTLTAPKLNNISVNGTSLTLSWEKTLNADGYSIYRKEKAEEDKDTSAWEALEEVDADTLKYVDSGLRKGTTYTYTVIPYRIDNGEKIWGKYTIKGVSGKALLNAPKLGTVTDSDEGVLFTWEKVNGADGYKVYRKLPGKNWNMVKDVEDTDSFIDTTRLDNMPYMYSVRAYQYDKDDPTVTVDGSYNTTGILYLPELEMPTVFADTEGNIVTLTWKNAEGMNGYNVYRRRKGEEWILLADSLQVDSTEFKDITVPKNGTYEYRIETYFKMGSDTYSFDLNNDFGQLSLKRSSLKLSTPEIVYGREDSTGITLVWEPQEDATSYRVYRKAEENGDDKWEVIKNSVSSNTYIDKPSDTGTYDYIIQSLYELDGVTYLGEFDEDEMYITDWDWD